MDIAVCLLTMDGRILVSQRSERMLHGLYVFYLMEDTTDPVMLTQLLCESGLMCRFVENLGHARHVFTHRVWEMELLHFELTSPPTLGGTRLVDAAELNALPFPSAMKAALHAAQKLISPSALTQ